MAYIANKPVRFDRTYAVGEVIPDEVIDPKMTRKLVEMGRIISVDLSPSSNNPGTPTAPAQEGAQEGAEGEGGTNTHGEPEPPTEPAPEAEAEEADPEAGGEFICPDCGRAFGSQNALSAHSRTHKG